MRYAKFASTEAKEAFELVNEVSEADAAGAGVWPDGLTEDAIDALICEVDAELEAEERTALVRVDRSFTDARRAARAARRSGREVLRSLPVRLSSESGEAA
ncbi:hypothetical protein [Amycolatopsis sp. YIM 10]|uniref:hypothetical protein n=1 Tax=Amycolatopsis sp. YIM 10 TaxID=2653857 RepID=UPI0012A7B213|nr:hypothetical protein [Amycolatopsis sp. YIM 10]QFU85729.1 hypothetical protein YIM_02520 [Amycolatopsis sp. YIM 10]